MSTRQKRQSRLPGLVIPTLCLATLCYFAYHAQTGSYTISTKAEMKARAKVLKQDLKDIRAERALLTKKVAQLTSGSLEKDALDEAARQNLGMVASDEFVILYR